MCVLCVLCFTFHSQLPRVLEAVAVAKTLFRSLELLTIAHEIVRTTPPVFNNNSTLGACFANILFECFLSFTSSLPCWFVGEKRVCFSPPPPLPPHPKFSSHTLPLAHFGQVVLVPVLSTCVDAWCGAYGYVLRHPELVARVKGRRLRDVLTPVFDAARVMSKHAPAQVPLWAWRKEKKMDVRVLVKFWREAGGMEFLLQSNSPFSCHMPPDSKNTARDENNLFFVFFWSFFETKTGRWARFLRFLPSWRL